MILKREGNSTILDGEGTMTLTKNAVALNLQGFTGKEPIVIRNIHMFGGINGNFNQIKAASKFIYSDEIEKGKVIAKKVGLVTYAFSLAVVIGVNMSMATKLIKNK